MSEHEAIPTLQSAVAGAGIKRQIACRLLLCNYPISICLLLFSRLNCLYAIIYIFHTCFVNCKAPYRKDSSLALYLEGSIHKC